MNDFKQRFEDLLDDIVNNLSKKEVDHIFCYFKERLDEIEDDCRNGNGKNTQKLKQTNL